MESDTKVWVAAIVFIVMLVLIILGIVQVTKKDKIGWFFIGGGTLGIMGTMFALV